MKKYLLFLDGNHYAYYDEPDIEDWETKSFTQKQFDSYGLDFFGWEYEDNLPTMSDETYKALYPFSKVIGGVRVFPFSYDSGIKFYITFV